MIKWMKMSINVLCIKHRYRGDQNRFDWRIHEGGRRGLVREGFATTVDSQLQLHHESL